MGDSPQFIRVPKTYTIVASTANANRDGSGTLATIATGKAVAVGVEGGTLIKRITATAQVATTAGALRFYIDGEIFWEEAVPVDSVGANDKSYTLTLAWPTVADPLYLGAGQVLTCSTEQAEAFAIVATGGDF